MDFVNKSYVQISELFATMSSGTRVTAGLLLVTVVLSLVYLVTQEVSDPDQYLFGAQPLTDREIARATVSLASADLADWDVQSNRIRVPRGKKHVYLAALAQNDALPKYAFDHLMKASTNSNIWMSDKQRQDMMKTANERELSDIIRNMSDIDKAVVRYMETIESRFPEKRRKVTAAVSIWPTRSSLFTNEHVDSIRQLVASAIGAEPGAIRVVDMVANKDRSNKLDHESSGLRLYQKVKQDLENYFAKKAREALTFIPEATVVVNVKLSDTVQTSKIEKRYNPQDSASVEQRSTSDTETFITKTPEDEDKVALHSQEGGANGAATVDSGSETKTIREKTVEESKSQVGEEYIEQVKQGLVPTQVTATVSVPQTYYRQVWQKRNPTAEGKPLRTPTNDEMRRLQDVLELDIRKAVAHVLPPIPADDDQYNPVQVVPFEVLETVKPEDPPLTANVVTWIGNNWSTLGMMLIGIFSLLILRNMVHAFPQNSSPLAATADPGGTEGAVRPSEYDLEANGQNTKQFVQRSSESRPNLREELVEIVREDPDAAAKVIRSWIGNAG